MWIFMLNFWWLDVLCGVLARTEYSWGLENRKAYVKALAYVFWLDSDD
jgi:hypothetical protein